MMRPPRYPTNQPDAPIVPYRETKRCLATALHAVSKQPPSWAGLTFGSADGRGPPDTVPVRVDARGPGRAAHIQTGDRIGISDISRLEDAQRTKAPGEVLSLLVWRGGGNGMRQIVLAAPLPEEVPVEHREPGAPADAASSTDVRALVDEIRALKELVRQVAPKEAATPPSSSDEGGDQDAADEPAPAPAGQARPAPQAEAAPEEGADRPPVVGRPWLGLVHDDVQREFAFGGRRRQLKPDADGPAFRAGIRDGDQALHTDLETIKQKLETMVPGDTVDLLVWRRGKELKFDIILGTAPPEVAKRISDARAANLRPALETYQPPALSAGSTGTRTFGESASSPSSNPKRSTSWWTC
jgi:hypothetical protein